MHLQAFNPAFACAIGSVMSQNVCPNAVDAWTRLVRAEQSLIDKVETDLKQAGFPPLTWYDVLWGARPFTRGPVAAGAGAVANTAGAV